MEIVSGQRTQAPLNSVERLVTSPVATSTTATKAGLMGRKGSDSGDDIATGSDRRAGAP